MEFGKTLVESPDLPVAENAEPVETPYAFPENGWEQDFNATVWKTPPSGLYSLSTKDIKDEGEVSTGLTIITRRLAEVETTLPDLPYAVFRDYRGHHISGLTKPIPPYPVGGDCVDVIHAPDGGLVVAVTDAEGKGVVAAGAGRMIHRAVRSAILSGWASLDEVLFKVNGALRRECVRGAVALAHIDGESVVVAVAGNPAPALVYRGKVTLLSTAGTLLGCTALPQFDVCRVEVPEGGTIALYSDGVTEAEAPDGELFDIRRFGPILDPGRSLTADLLACVDSVLAHCSHQQDDISLALIRGGIRQGAPVRRAVGGPRTGAASARYSEVGPGWYEPGIPYPADAVVHANVI
jgi:hypothetical protein